jgi:3-phenylpropionate/trans-cinnamate dioxygenase ferredoxin component
MPREVRLCALDEIEPGTAKRFEVEGSPIALVRFGDDLYAIGDTCSHAEVSLSEGELDEETGHVECWKHGSSFDVRTGEPDTLPATRPVPTYTVRVDGGDVKVVLET